MGHDFNRPRRNARRGTLLSGTGLAYLLMAVTGLLLALLLAMRPF